MSTVSASRHSTHGSRELSGAPQADMATCEVIMQRHKAKLVPVFNVTVTDEQLGVLGAVKLRPYSLEKVIRLMEHPHSENLIDRHTHALGKLTRSYERGFLLRDLYHVIRLLHVACERVDEQPHYIEHIETVLRICAKGFLKEKNSDEVAYEELGQSMMCQLGYLLRTPCLSIQRQIADTIMELYTAAPTAPSYGAMERTSLQYHQFLIESSDAATSILKTIHLLDLDSDTHMKCVCVLQKLSRHSPVLASQLTEGGAAAVICKHLDMVDPGGEEVFRFVEILWNLLELADPQEVIAQLSLEALQAAFLFNLTQTHSYAHRQLRNDLITLVSLVGANRPEADFLECGLLRQVITLATFPEIQTRSPLVNHLKLTTSAEDFELKKLLWNCLVQLAGDINYHPTLRDGCVVHALASFVSPNEFISEQQTRSSVREWSPAQHEELQLHALASLATILPALIDQYKSSAIGTRLLTIIEWAIRDDEKYLGAGNSFFGAGGYRNKRAQLRYAVRLLYAITSTREKDVLDDLADQGAVQQLVAALAHSLTSIDGAEGKKWDAVEVEYQADMLVILSTMCDADEHRRALFDSEGVDVLSRLLQATPAHLNSGLGHQRLLMTAVECAWACVVGAETTESYFLEKDGVFLLMDLSEKCPHLYQALLLGCLVDLLENPKAVKHLHTWRGRGDVTPARHFLKLWRQEETMFGVARNTDGTMSNPAAPLMTSSQQQDAALSPLPETEPNLAILDLGENLRSKIYSIFLKLGFSDLPGLEPEDNVTKPLVERFLDLKLTEVWEELDNELAMEGLEPVEFDKECLEIIRQAGQEKVGLIVGDQVSVLQAAEQQVATEELQYYSSLRENQLQRQRAFDRYSDLLARTSRYENLRIARQRQALATDASRPFDSKKLPNFHPLQLNNINTTVYSGRCLAVDSTANAVIGGRVARYNTEQMRLAKTKLQQQQMEVEPAGETDDRGESPE